MPYLGNVPSSFNVGTNNIDNGAVTTEKIADGAVVNADVSASAAIAGTKISPDFGSQNLLTTVTATAASFIPSSSTAPTNGLYLSAANTVGISTNGSGRLFVDSNGNVGVGGSVGFGAIDHGIHVTGSGAQEGIRLQTSAGSSGILEVYAESGGATLDTRGSGYIRFNNVATEWARFDSSGRLGIGTTSPSVKLEVNGDIFASGGDIYTGANRMLSSDSTIRPLIFGIGAGEKARIDSSGRLLVGTSSSSTVAYSATPNLQVESTSYITSSLSVFNNENGDSGSIISLGKSRGTSVGSNTVVQNNDFLGTIAWVGADGSDRTSVAAYISCLVDATPGANDMPGRLVFSTTADGASSPTERMRLTQQGVLKVSNDGTYANSTGPYHEFVSSHNDEYAFRVWHRGNASQQYGIYVRTTTDQNDATRTFLECAGNVTLRAAIRSNGGLANYSANNANLSDRNAKKDITPAAGTWDCIKEWEIVNYRYKDQPDDADLNLGVIAQQVAESCPEVITVFSEAKDAKPAVLDDDGNEVEPAQEAQPEKLGVKEQQMYWMAIKALQEAQVRIESLEAINADLLARVTALESV